MIKHIFSFKQITRQSDSVLSNEKNLISKLIFIYYNNIIIKGKYFQTWFSYFNEYF